LTRCQPYCSTSDANRTTYASGKLPLMKSQLIIHPFLASSKGGMGEQERLLQYLQQLAEPFNDYIRLNFGFSASPLFRFPVRGR